MRYFIGLIDDMTIDEIEVWRMLCKYSNFETNITGYTINQIVISCDSRLNITTQKVRTIIKKFVNNGYIDNVIAGTKGKDTKARLILKDKLFKENELTTIQQQSNNHLTNKSERLQYVDELNNNNLTTIQQQSNNTIKEKEKRKDIYSDKFNELWCLYPRKVGKPKAYSSYKKLIKKYTYEQIEESIKIYLKEIEMYKTDERFIKHGSTFFNCIEEDYIKGNKKAPAPTDANVNKKTNYSDIICNNGISYSPSKDLIIDFN